KSLSETQRKDYRNHHKVRYIMMQAISQSEFIKLTDISTAKVVYNSLCVIYERKTQDGYLEDFSDVEEAEKSLMTIWDDLDKVKEADKKATETNLTNMALKAQVLTDTELTSSSSSEYYSDSENENKKMSS
ncbi:hypothetical protein A2U01_0032146, partial [Trifolium medium]|nr:hypothetical protein [Trifolium medium]